MTHQPAVQRHVLSAHADVTAPDLALFDQPAGHVFSRVDAQREADSLRRKNHRRIDPDHFAARIDQLSARIAWIQRRIGLDDIVNEPAGVGPERPAQGANDASRDSALKTIRAADGDGELADANAL